MGGYCYFLRLGNATTSKRKEAARAEPGDLFSNEGELLVYSEMYHDLGGALSVRITGTGADSDHFEATLAATKTMSPF